MKHLYEGVMVYWRFRKDPLLVCESGEWRFGYAYDVNKPVGMVHMGQYNGDTMHGKAVSLDEIEFRPFR